MKRIIVLLCLMILSNLCSQAQEKSKPTVRIKMDSLMSQLSPLNEAGKAKAFNEYFHGYIQQNIDEAYQALELIEERSREEKDTSILINSLVLTAEYYWRKGAYKDGIVYGLEAVKLAESNARFEYELARSYQNLGTIHLFLYNREAAVKYYKQASKLFFKLGDVKSLCSIYNNTGVAYMDAAKMKTNTIFTDSALFYFEKTINQKGKARVSTVLNALGNSGGIYVIQENWSKAKTIFDEWIELEKANKNISARAMIYGNIGVMHLRLRNYTLAEKYLYEGLDLAIGLGSKFEIQEYYHYLSELNESKGSYKEALDYNNKWVSLKDSIYNADKVTQINELETKYDTDKKEQQITQLEQENIIQELEAQRQKQLKTFSVIAVGLLLLAVGLLYSRYRSKNKTNTILDAKNQELAKLNQTKDRLFSIISHDLKSPLSSFHTITKSLSDNWDVLEKEQLKDFVITLRDSSADVKNMMDNLLKWALAQTDQLSYRPSQVDSQQVVQKVIKELSAVTSLKNIPIELEVKGEEKIKADKDFLQIVIRNLLSNALKFSDMNSKIEVLVEENDGAQVICIRDYGIGMEQMQVDQLFAGIIVAQDIQNSTEKGTGLGLVLCKELMERMGGEISAESEKGKGTIFKLQLPRAA